MTGKVCYLGMVFCDVVFSDENGRYVLIPGNKRMYVVYNPEKKVWYPLEALTVGKENGNAL